jgi:ABC-2 type transport system ATP-binding protein
MNEFCAARTATDLPSIAMGTVIEADSVSKCFRQHRRFPGILGTLRSLFTREFTEVKAVDGISFSVQAGEALGYLGPNGAGKSTMIKMLTGILHPTSGRLSVLGRVPHAERISNAREIGVVFGQRSQLWWDLPLIDSFELQQRIYKIPKERYRLNLDRFAELLAMSSFIERPVRQLSLGQRMRAEIVMALLHDPKILFLDEPTIGLDVVAKDAVRRFIQEMNRQREVTVILTTHDLQDIEQICPRLILVNEAKLVFDGEVTRLRAALGSKRKLKLEFSTDPGVITLPYATLATDGGALKLFTIQRDDVSLVQILSDLHARSDLKDISIEEPSIEDLVRTVYASESVRAARTDGSN